MLRRCCKFIAITLALVLTVSTLSASIVMAQDEGTVIADGLNGPMGVLVAPDGTIWVVDSGLGGDEEIETMNPETGESVVATIGETTEVAQIDPSDGSQEVIVNLPSIALPDGAEGGGKLALVDGVLYVTSGSWIGAARDEALPNTASVLAIGEDGSVTEVAQTWVFERDQNPDETILESHPYGITGGPDGMLYVADAAGNTLLLIDPDNGSIASLAVFEPLPGVFPNPARGGELLTDPVPTDVVVADDGTAYVSLLSGAPFIPGSAKVVAVAPDGSVTDYATGLTMLTDLTSGPDGNMYAVQFAIFSDQGPTPNSGAVIRIVEGDASTTVIDNLSFPTSVDFDADGNAYVSINGVGAPGSGAIVMYEGIAGSAEIAEAETADMETTEEEPADAEMTDEEMAGEEPAEAEMTDAEMTEEEPASEELAGEEIAGAETADEQPPAPHTMPTTGAGRDHGVLGILVSLVVVAGLGLLAKWRRRLA